MVVRSQLFISFYFKSFAKIHFNYFILFQYLERRSIIHRDLAGKKRISIMTEIYEKASIQDNDAYILSALSETPCIFLLFIGSTLEVDTFNRLTATNEVNLIVSVHVLVNYLKTRCSRKSKL